MLTRDKNRVPRFLVTVRVLPVNNCVKMQTRRNILGTKMSLLHTLHPTPLDAYGASSHY